MTSRTPGRTFLEILDISLVLKNSLKSRNMKKNIFSFVQVLADEISIPWQNISVGDGFVSLSD